MLVLVLDVLSQKRKFACMMQQFSWPAVWKSAITGEQSCNMINCVSVSVCCLICDQPPQDTGHCIWAHSQHCSCYSTLLMLCFLHFHQAHYKTSNKEQRNSRTRGYQLLPSLLQMVFCSCKRNGVCSCRNYWLILWLMLHVLVFRTCTSEAAPCP